MTAVGPSAVTAVTAVTGHIVVGTRVVAAALESPFTALRPPMVDIAMPALGLLMLLVMATHPVTGSAE